MNILFVVDGRSPTALNWIEYFVDHGYEVHLVSMFPCHIDLNLASLTILPVVFSNVVEESGSSAGLKTKILSRLATPKIRTWLRHLFVPSSLPTAAEKLNTLITKIKPDIVHAMRVPYEGILAALAYQSSRELRPSLLISIWGNDFTLHASATPRLSTLTKLTMETADALHSDCYRDQVLANAWGFDKAKPAIVLPGAGGIQLDNFYPPDNEPDPIVINPRGLRSYVRSDTYFKAIPLVLNHYSDAHFLCPDMLDKPEAASWVYKLRIENAVDILPRQSRLNMADLYRMSRVVVSPSTHDGTPNTLLEAMACGCFPIAGDITSIREWITPGLNGLVFDPADCNALAAAICEGLGNQTMRIRAKEINLELIRERAEYGSVMQKAAVFYCQLSGL